MASYNAYLEFARPLGDAILDWAKPKQHIIGGKTLPGWPTSPMANWPLAKFEDAFLIAICYLLFVFFGSLIMSQRSIPQVKGLYPFKFLYNMSQVMLCSYMCIDAGVQAYKNNYSLIGCNNFDFKDPKIGPILYIFYLSKILDFLDTAFIIAEKRWGQLSFLHVYHHFSIFLFYWLNVNVGYDGDVYLTIVLNGLIHTIMYNYYFITQHTKDIWWKSHLTSMQMVQFMCMNAQALYLISSGCQKYPRNITMAYLYYIISLLILFAHFFVMSYIVKGGKSKKSKKSE